MSTWYQAIGLGILEGLTEFLPVSSTGHLIIAQNWLDFQDNSQSFTIAIQLGAILAICLLYYQRLSPLVYGVFNDRVAQNQVLFIVLAFLPAAFLGVLFHDTIKQLLFSPMVVASALIIGGVVMIIVERLPKKISINTIEALGWRRALFIGFMQSLAMIPGTSRSGATIIGALWLGVERRTAAEFSFFLAIPTMLGASVYDVYKNIEHIDMNSAGLIAAGFIAALLTALIVVKTFVMFVSRYGFTLFGVYRIILGLLLFLVFAQ